MAPLNNTAIAGMSPERINYFPALIDLTHQKNDGSQVQCRSPECDDDQRKIFYPPQIAIDTIQRDVQYRMSFKAINTMMILQAIQNASKIRRSLILFVLYYAENVNYDSHCRDEDRIAYENGMDFLCHYIDIPA